MASSVGVKVIALILKKYDKDLNLPNIICILNIGVLTVGFIVYGLKSVVVGILFSICYSKVLDLFSNK